jgi:hypothetical protein
VSGSDQAAATDAGAAPISPAEGRQRSTIGFPYADLQSAEDIAAAVFNQVGGGGCDDDQLAAWTKQSAKSSTFRVEISAARMFGVLEGEGGRHRLSELGLSLVDPQRQREARVRAFLNVPLYRAIFEAFRGRQLPPAAALEREFVGLGVAPKQKDRARQVFERSADQAGFFANGRDRLVQPGIRQDDAGSGETEKNDQKGRSGGGDGSDGELDPVIAALTRKLPPTGQPWPTEARVRWLQMMEMAFQEAYGETPDQITIARRAVT